MDRGGLLARLQENPNILLVDPQPYTMFLSLVRFAALVVTDSGGVQEETTFFGVPCLTVRPNTERPITLTHGTNRLCTVAELACIAKDILHCPPVERPGRIPLWDGSTAPRVAESVFRFLQRKGLFESCAPQR